GELCGGDPDAGSRNAHIPSRRAGRCWLLKSVGSLTLAASCHRDMSAMAAIIALAAATFVSEDIACITAGQLVRDGRVVLAAGIAGCLLGIYVGDLALWALGQLIGTRALSWRWIAARVSRSQIDNVGKWLDRRLPAAILTARFVPGARLPTFLSAGMLGR